MTLHGYNTLNPALEWPDGVRRIRLWDCGVSWAETNPEPGVFDFRRLDDIFDRHPKADYLMVLSATPTWAATAPDSQGAAWLPKGSNSPPKRMNDWTAYVQELCVRYSDYISAFQVWNEPQLRDFWSPYGDIDKLGQMTTAARQVIRRYASGAKVIAAPVLPRTSSGGMRRAGLYLQALRTRGWPVDGFSAHIYPEVGKGPSVWREHVQRVQKGLAAMGAPDRPLWVTETNYNLMGGPLRPATQASRVNATAKACTDLGVARLYWYAYGTHGDPAVLGIPFAKGTAGALAEQKYL